MKILGMAASLRKGSFNRQLIRRAAEHARSAGAEVSVADLKEFIMPYYDGDLEESSGVPESARKLSSLIQSHDALLISSPEYNASIPGHFKNTLDWISRLKPNVFSKKPILLMTASPGYYGGIRSHPHLRASFDVLGSFVYPSIVAIADAAHSFTPTGELSDPEDAALLEKTVKTYFGWAAKILAQ